MDIFRPIGAVDPITILCPMNRRPWLYSPVGFKFRYLTHIEQTIHIISPVVGTYTGELKSGSSKFHSVSKIVISSGESVVPFPKGFGVFVGSLLSSGWTVIVYRDKKITLIPSKSSASRL